MSSQSYATVQQHYSEAMRYTGLEATGRLWVADRLAEATRDALLTEAACGTPRMRPLFLSLGSLLVRIGERLESVGAMQQSPDCV